MQANIRSCLCIFLALISFGLSPVALARDAEPDPTAQHRAAPVGFLKTSGRNILNSAGEPIYLRGINLHTYYYQYQWDENSPWQNATQQDIRYLKSLGVTAIRLALHWRYFDTDLGFQLIDTYIRWCEQAGIYLILDMHIAPPDEEPSDRLLWDDPESKQAFLDLWQSIATRYASKTIIAGYDLYNEPIPPQAADWWELVADTIRTIRTVDKRHILFVEPPLVGDERLERVEDSNVVYSYHDYTPFVMTHAGYAWAWDSPVPNQYAYPGKALVNTEWADWAQDAQGFRQKASTWQKVSSGWLTVPTGVEFATVKLAASGNTGSVWFDDVSVTHQGRLFNMFNASMEKAAILDKSLPANWYFWSETGFTGKWDKKNRLATGGQYSLKITGNSSDGFGVWNQQYNFYTNPLVKVKAGERIRVDGWMLAPDNKGEISISADYLRGVYTPYNKKQLRLDIKKYTDWAKTNNVPLYVGEFGVISSAPKNTRHNLVRDKISIMNEAGLHWGLWAYRDLASPHFGMYLNGVLDSKLAAELKAGLQ